MRAAVGIDNRQASVKKFNLAVGGLPLLGGIRPATTDKLKAGRQRWVRADQRGICSYPTDKTAHLSLNTCSDSLCCGTVRLAIQTSSAPSCKGPASKSSL